MHDCTSLVYLWLVTMFWTLLLRTSIWLRKSIKTLLLRKKSFYPSLILCVVSNWKITIITSYLLLCRPLYVVTIHLPLRLFVRQTNSINHDQVVLPSLTTYLIKLELGVFMYKYFNGLLPMSFNAFFTKLSDIHNYDTRIISNYNPTKNKKVFADKAIRTTGPILWNSIDKNIKKSISTKYFRKLYKSSLINSYT